MTLVYLAIHLIGENTIAITGIVDTYREDLGKQDIEEEWYHDITYNSKEIENIIIPTEIDGYKVTEIGNGAFYKYSSLKSIKIPNSITIIGNRAFGMCKGLTNIVIPNSVITIGNETFWCCSNLTNVAIPSSITTIGYDVFSFCYSLTNITIQKGSPLNTSSANYPWGASASKITFER